MFVFCICDSLTTEKGKEYMEALSVEMNHAVRSWSDRKKGQTITWLFKNCSTEDSRLFKHRQCKEEVKGEYSAQLDSKLIYCEKKKHTLTPNQSGRTVPLSDMTLKQFQKKRKVVKLHNFEWPFKASKRPPHCGEGQGMFHRQRLLWSKSTKYGGYVKD